jgi:hypothetical protein
MSINRSDEQQLSLDFERNLDSVPTAFASRFVEVQRSAITPRLTLVIDNGRHPSDPPNLSPNSLEITRILDEQRKSLSWY